MKIDLDQAMAVAEHQSRALPWELVLTIGGADYRVKPLAISDVAEISRAQQMREIEQIRGLLFRLLENPPAEAALISDEQIAVAIGAIAIGFGEHLKKKSHVLEKAIRASTTSNSSGS